MEAKCVNILPLRKLRSIKEQLRIPIRTHVNLVCQPQYGCKERKADQALSGPQIRLFRLVKQICLPMPSADLNDGKEQRLVWNIKQVSVPVNKAATKFMMQAANRLRHICHGILFAVAG